MRLSLRHRLKSLGPGLVTGSSDDDPSGIATYSQAGAQSGFNLLWTALLTYPLMAAVQEICDRTALATKKSLGELARDRFGTFWKIVISVLIFVLIAANTLNIAADLVAIGAGINLLGGGPIWLWAIIAGGVITGVTISGTYQIVSQVFKYLCAALLAYLIVPFFIHVKWADVAIHTIVPHLEFNKTYLALMIAVLGTTISPYLFFWQSAYRVEDMKENDRAPLAEDTPKQVKQEVADDRFDVFFGMAFSNVVMFAIILATASAFIGKHVTINSASDAASALKPVAGHFATLLFAIGFIGSGFLAIPVLAGSGASAAAGLAGKAYGFGKSARKAPLFYILVLVGMVIGTLLTLLNVNPIRLLVLVAELNGVAAVPFLVLVMVISSSRTIMGDYVNGRLALLLGWGTVLLMVAATVGLFLTI